MGRSGHLSEGISHCGAMDKRMAAMTNIKLGNAINAPLIEFAHLAPKLKALANTTMAIEAVSCDILVDDLIQKSPLDVKKGQVIGIKMKAGVYGYLGISGGFYAEKEYGSVSYHHLTKIGGGKLEKGDLVKMQSGQSKHLPNNLASIKLPSYNSNVIRCRRGIEFSMFLEEEIIRFLENEHLISNDGNRMGIKLKSASPMNHDFSIISSPVLPGTLQLPPGGNIIVLGNDGQSIGGYPRIASVVKEDMAILVQKRPGEKIKFAVVY